MHPTLERLLTRRPVLTDGAWGTQLQVLGLPVGHCPEEWNLAHADRIEKIARSYVEAGSRVVLTNTFGANRVVLDKHGLAERTVQVNQVAVEISRRAAGDRADVFASIGPSGKMLMTGQISPDELQSIFSEQASVLADAGADGLVIETMTDVEEAKVALEAAKQTGLPVVVCMVFDSGKDLDRTMMGTTPEQAAGQLEAAGADAIGANCGQGIAGTVEVCRRFRAATGLPIWIKPNAGIPEVVDGRIIYKTTPEEFARHAPELVDAGVDFLGGCCGTTPEFIAAIADAIRR